MPRKPRPVAPNTVYHVTLQCNNKELLIKTRKDLESVLCVVAHYKLEYKFKFYGYYVTLAT